MLKLAILGANGQVGAELCLMLAGRADLILVPVCRNRSGSAFLRWQGIPCRHGRVAEEADARRLLADCDVVVNCSLATGTPAEIRRIEDRIIQNAFAHSKPGATVIHFSTQSVYGDPGAHRWIRWRNPYGRAKLFTERSVRAAARRFGKAAYILRLGHVCGALQNISLNIRAEIAADAVLLPVPDRSSNTVYTAAIVGAVLQIVRGESRPGTYDLMNSPRWTWKEVYEFEGTQCGTRFSPTYVQTTGPRPGTAVSRLAIKLAASLTSVQWIRDALSKVFAHVPDAANARAQAWWYRRRARTEIGELRRTRHMAEHLTWVENGKRFFPASATTKDLLASMPFPGCRPPVPAGWADDLQDANAASESINWAR
jgi:nucleoside-diphosphate-sugar epimerase